MTKVTIRENAADYTPAERLQIIWEGMNGSMLVKEVYEKYGISKDTYHAWKNALMGSIEEMWGRNHAGRPQSVNQEDRKKIAALEGKVVELEAVIESKDVKIARDAIVLAAVSEEFQKQAIKTKGAKVQIADIIESRKSLSIQECCKIIGICSDTYYNIVKMLDNDAEGKKNRKRAKI